MIIYSSTKQSFCDDILTNDIENKILTLMRQKTFKSVGAREVASWKNSLMYMNTVLQDEGIPNSAGISIEYHIPNSSKRIDFIITGQTAVDEECVVIVELKQWSSAKATDMPGIVSTRFLQGEKDVPHPSYQAWSYSKMIEDFNETVETDNVQLKPCAYLHNYSDDGVINGDFYKEEIDRAPLFLKSDALKLREFIKKWVKFGDAKNVLYRIENGKIRPSKSLANHLSSLMAGNQEFTLIDEQKLVFEAALKVAGKSHASEKNVLIIKGGPGTGKSVLAINLLVEITKRGQLCQYVTKNAAPRAVYEAMLTGHLRKTQISNLFVGSGAFIDAKKNSFDVLVVDEAHRLNEKSGLYGVDGENQIKELIDSSKTSVFFIDEDQRIHIKDIGTKGEIEKWAKKTGAAVTHLELSSQFRCNGSDGYLAWLDHSLQIRETANPDIADLGYDFQVFDCPNKLLSTIKKKNAIRNKSRVVAGYCWNWISKNGEPDLYDIDLEEHKFKMKWNLKNDGPRWIINSNTVSEAGCIHTCQGLELDYVGVIIGPDFVIRDGKVVTDFTKRARSDQSLKGIKKLYTAKPKEAVALADSIIKNTYRTLMTRGLKGCYLFCTDEETRNYFRSMAPASVKPYPMNQHEFSMVAESGKKYSAKKKKR